MRAYAIGDIHGHFDQLVDLHDRIAEDMITHGHAPIIHIGDLVDRGPESANVIEYLMLGIAQGEDWVVIKGNHDFMFQRFLEDPLATDTGLRPGINWLYPRVGGSTTLASYGVSSNENSDLNEVHAEAIAAVPPAHLQFLAQLPTSHRIGNVFFAHAGIRPDIPLSEQEAIDLMWIREPFLSHKAPHEALIIHGHTAIDLPTHYGNRVNIDSGAAYGGPLSVVVIENNGESVYWLTKNGRIPLAP